MPMVHMLINPFALPMYCAASLISFVEIPQISAALESDVSETFFFKASKLLVLFWMNFRSIFLVSINLLAMALCKTTSVPGRICKCKSAMAADCVFLGSTRMILVSGLFSLCFSNRRNRMGWHHAGFAPVIKKVSANSMSS